MGDVSSIPVSIASHLSMDWGIFVIQVMGVLVSAWAAFSAWRAATAAKDTVEAARAEIELQRAQMQQSAEEAKARELPKLTSVFRFDGGSVYIDISNYGGVATNIHFDVPKFTKTRTNLEKELYDRPLADLAKSVAFRQGIDVLRPGETIAFRAGAYSQQEFSDLHARSLMRDAHPEYTDDPWMIMSFDTEQGTFHSLMLFNLTARSRKDPE